MLVESKPSHTAEYGFALADVVTLVSSWVPVDSVCGATALRGKMACEIEDAWDIQQMPDCCNRRE